MSWSKITSVALCGVVLSSCSFIMYPAVGFFVGYVSTVPVSCNPVVQSRMRYLKTGIVCEHVVVDRNETGFVSVEVYGLWVFKVHTATLSAETNQCCFVLYEHIYFSVVSLAVCEDASRWPSSCVLTVLPVWTTSQVINCNLHNLHNILKVILSSSIEVHSILVLLTVTVFWALLAWVSHHAMLRHT